MSAPDWIAAPDTVLGLLQRGRGEGYRRVLELPRAEAQELLFKCITRDPRLDPQCDSRSQYYAWIAIEIELPLEPLAEYLRRNDRPGQESWATLLTVETLTELAKRNYASAREIICDYIRWGQEWNRPIYDLLDFPEDEFVKRIARAVEQHFPSDDALDRVMCGYFFVNLARFSSRIDAAVARMPRAGAEEMLPDLTSLSLGSILDSANDKNYRPLGKAIAEITGPTDVELLRSRVSLQNPFAAHVALAGLTKIAPASLLEWLLEMWLEIPEPSAEDRSQNRSRALLRQGISRAIVRLPAAATLPIARDWIAQQDSRKQELAERLFQEHAATEDIPILRKTLLPMLIDEDAEWRCLMIRAFYNLPNAGFIQELVDIFHHFRFSYGRYYAAKAIQITSPDFFAGTLALECLWDCEEGTRELGVQFAPLESSEALQRIRHLAEDAYEDEDVRAAAKARLERINPLQPAG